MKSIYLKFVFILVLTLAGSTVSYGQINCPDGSGAWTDNTINYGLGRYGEAGSVDYKLRQKESEYQVIIDWTTLQNNSDFLTDEILKKLLQNELILSFVGWYNTQQKNVAIYSKKNCFVDVGVWLEVDEARQLECATPGFNWDEMGGIESWVDEKGSQHYFYRVKQPIICGEKCCKTLYVVQTVLSDDWGTSTFIVGEPVVTEVTPCTSPNTYLDCRTNEPLPCYSEPCE